MISTSSKLPKILETLEYRDTSREEEEKIEEFGRKDIFITPIDMINEVNCKITVSRENR